MARRDIEFDAEGVTLRSWYYPAQGSGAPGPAVVMPPGFHAVTPKLGIRPSYTDAAMKAHVEGSAWVQAIVGADGRVERVRLVKSLDPVNGLDEEALKAARQWTFIPATRGGQPVRALAMMELTFTLRK